MSTVLGALFPPGLLAAFPAPPADALHIGPLRLGFYGLMIGIGAFLAVRLFGHRLEASGSGSRDDAVAVATWALPAGVIGSRAYHVMTDWSSYVERPLVALQFWRGGLGIWGGISAGVAVGVLVAVRRGVGAGASLTAVAPALPLAQAFGRWGNWFNEELFGRPTELPWGLEVSAAHLPPGTVPGTLFHPTFLYESLGCLLLAAGLVVLDRRVRLRPGRLLLAYVSGYTLLRLPVEALRIDPVTELAGLRVSQGVAAVLFALATPLLLREILVSRRRS